MKRTIILLITIMLSPMAYSQDCGDILEKANKSYEAGDFTQVLSLLDSCTSTNNESQMWQSHRLRAMSHLGLNEQDFAKQAVYELLELNPTYKPNSLNDPSTLVKLINSVTIIPKFSFGLALSIGTNSTFPKVNNGYFVVDQNKIYTGKNSYQFGVSTSYQFSKKLGVDIMAMASSKSYELDYSFDNWDLSMEETLTYVNIPIMARYIPNFKGRIRPFVQVGGYVGRLMIGDNSFYAKYKPDNTSFSLEHINSLVRRKRMDYGLATGLGAYYRKGDGQLFIDINYYHSGTNIADPKNRYDYSELQQSYHYLDDDVRLSNLAISVGYSLYLDYRVIRDK